MIEYNATVIYKDIFEGSLPELKHLLQGISRSKLMTYTSFFLGLSERDSKFGNYKDFLQEYFCAENAPIATEIYEKLRILEKSRKGNIVIVTIQSMLQLFEFCFTNLDENETQTNPEVEINIFKAMLLLNERNGEIQTEGMSKALIENEEIRLSALSLGMNYATSELFNYDVYDVLFGQFIRAIYLFEFLENHPTTQNLLNGFLIEYDCNNWREYFSKIYPIILAIIKSQREGIIEISIEQNEQYKSSCDFIDKLVLSTTGAFDEGYDFRTLRTSPLYKIDEGRYRVVFALFTHEMIYKGLFFKLKKINDSLPSNERPSSNFRGWYCDHFSERELLYKSFKVVFGNKYIQHAGEEIKAKYGVNSELDYYMRNGNYAFLFESKDIFINGEIKQSSDYLEYRDEFIKKLYFSYDKKGKCSDKAVLQLIGNIRKILTYTLPNDSNYKVRRLRVYPIIVLHDRQFNVGGLNHIVNYWFNYELELLKDEGINIENVRPITIIDIETFLLYQENFKNGDFSLNSIIDEYISYCTVLKKQYKSQYEMEEYAQRKLIPFSLFLYNYVQKQGIFKPPQKQLLQFGIKLFE